MHVSCIRDIMLKFFRYDEKQCKFYLQSVKIWLNTQKSSHLFQDLKACCIIGWFKMHQSQKIYPATSFLEQIYLVLQENAKKVEKSYHLGVPNQLRRLCTVR